jgi:hypothetical protein
MNVESVTLKVIDALSEVGIPFMLVDSFSSNFYGVPRSTKDADFVVQLNGRQLDGLVEKLGPDFNLDPQLTFETTTGTFRHLVEVKGKPFKVELFIVSSDTHDQERWGRKRVVALLGRQICLPSPEDVIVSKLRWERSKDKEDVRDVIAVQRSQLDWAYVNQWCDQHGTRDLLEQIRQTVPPI